MIQNPHFHPLIFFYSVALMNNVGNKERPYMFLEAKLLYNLILSFSDSKAKAAIDWWLSSATVKMCGILVGVGRFIEINYWDCLLVFP